MTERPDLDALASAIRQPHLVNEADCWYSCPASGECCQDDAGDVCDCGADRRNEATATLLAYARRLEAEREAAPAMSLFEVRREVERRHPEWGRVDLRLVTLVSNLSSRVVPSSSDGLREDTP